MAEFNESDHPRGEGGKFTVSFEATPGRIGTKEYQSKSFPSMGEAIAHAKEQGWHVGNERTRQEHPEAIKYQFGHSGGNNVTRFHHLVHQGHSPGALVEREHKPAEVVKPSTPKTEEHKKTEEAEAAKPSEEKPKEKPPKNPDETWTAYRKRIKRLGFDDAEDRAIALDSVRTEDIDGRMRVAVMNISKACVNPYKGSEIPGSEAMGLDPDRVYYLYRDPEELAKAAASSNGVQILRKHIPVNAEDHQPWDVIGATGTDGAFEYPYLQNSGTFWVADDIAAIKSGKKKQISLGYHYKPDMTPGIVDGVPFDGRMRSIIVNHLTTVEDGRAGPDVVVADEAPNAAAWRAVEQALLTI